MYVFCVITVDGLQRLTDRLYEVVSEQGAEVHTQTPCTKIEFIPDPNATHQKVSEQFLNFLT